MAVRGIKVSKGAKEGFRLMPEGATVLHITKVEMIPKGRPHKVKVQTVNEDDIKFQNTWDLDNEMQERMFWTFYNTGCGLDEDDEGYSNPMDMQDMYVDVDMKHVVKEKQTIIEEDEDGCEIEKTLPERTFVNLGYIYGPVDSFGEFSENRKDEPAPRKNVAKKRVAKQVEEAEDDELDLD